MPARVKILKNVGTIFLKIYYSISIKYWNKVPKMGKEVQKFIKRQKVKKVPNNKNYD